MRLTWLNKG
uniref:Uncharacterized protein n=1 Tax=Anguilla anguilla TaxID=7936 RepID=A0A0E9Q806_ANGAN